MGLVTWLEMPIELPGRLKRLLSGAEYSTIERHIERYYGKKNQKKSILHCPSGKKVSYSRLSPKAELMASCDYPDLFRKIDPKYVIHAKVCVDKISDNGDLLYNYNPNKFSKKGKIWVDIDLVVFRSIRFYYKGANQRFYEDGIPYNDNSILVFDKETLLKHHDMYFSGGDGEDNSYGMTDEECRNGFFLNIVKHFKDGKTFVLYG